jgi:hypothetical protein
MKPAHAIHHLARILATALASLLACAAAPTALATPRPQPPGWNKHPPLPTRAQPAIRYPPAGTSTRRCPPTSTRWPPPASPGGSSP